MRSFPIAERFLSINGEGQRAGELAAFLRLPGCNLRCTYCDTAWANEPGLPVENLSLEEIVAWLREMGAENVTVTGGEPLLQPEIEGLLHALSHDHSFRVEVETNGSVFLGPVKEAAPKVSFTMDYKMPHSGMEDRMHPGNLAALGRGDTLKLVCGSRRDLDRARAMVAGGEVPPGVPVYLSPVFGEITPLEIVDYMKEYHMTQVRLQLQLHKIIWPPEERGV